MSPIAWWLLRKEFRELSVSRATLVLALAIGPLVGQAFITAVETFAEASGVARSTGALAQGLSPLDGIVAPTFGAYSIAVTLLFPFVCIRSLSADKESGALKLMLQSRANALTLVLSKFAVLKIVWLMLWIPGIVALVLWKSFGGHLSAPETLNVLLGHLLRGALTASIAMAAAAISESAATAAIITLAVTLGGWAIDFIAQIKGGVYEQLAAFTPDALLRNFEHGLLSASHFMVVMILTSAMLSIAVVWIAPGRKMLARVRDSLASLVLAIALCTAASHVNASFDASEDRRNSFEEADEQALERIRVPLVITAYLAPEDPRRADLDREVMRKLKRTMRDVHIAYVSKGSTGLFERRLSNDATSAQAADSAPQYGEVWYQSGERREMSRSSIEEVVLETIYRVTGTTPPTKRDDAAYPGWPLATQPTGAAFVFYLLFPLLTLVCWYWNKQRVAFK